MMREKEKDKKSQFSQIEEDLLKVWEREKTFEKSVQQREGAEHFEFYDGPPFANGLPHFGHSLVISIKDSILRYKTMRGFHAPRRVGWDCHGLPVEYAIEKELNVSGKKQILELGLAKFNAACRDSIFKYKADWEAFMTRIGRWSDYQNYYATVDTNYTESVWWVLSEINKKGLLYRGFKSLPYCPRCATPLSNFELNEGYRDNVPDPSVFVTFPLVEEPNTKFLVWTTTPWTLPANIALAVKSDADYAYVRLKSDGSTLILAKSRVEELTLRKTDYSLLKTVRGSELVSQRYQPLYPLNESKYNPAQAENAYQVFAEDNISLEDGTGILHVAPRYGETDLSLGQRENLPLIESVDSTGHMVDDLTDIAGQFFKDADQHIIAKLAKDGRIFAAETAEHTYPFCWRCDTPLMYFATNTWFIEVSKVREDMLKTAEQINWTPAHIKSGRFGKWLEGARDWAISRNRYWGAPLPIWQNVDDEDDYIVVGSIDELRKLAGEKEVLQALQASGVQGAGEQRTEMYKDGTSKEQPQPATPQSAASAGGVSGSAGKQVSTVLDLHRPFIDEIQFTKGGKTYRHVEEVLDCWFESGSMSVAQWHYPFKNTDAPGDTQAVAAQGDGEQGKGAVQDGTVSAQRSQQRSDAAVNTGGASGSAGGQADVLRVPPGFPADFITEGLDQTHLWFYVQHVISTVLFNRPAYKNVIVNGIMLAADGEKLSKRLKNYPPTDEVFNSEGADAWRLYMLSSTQATETADYLRFDRSALTDTSRNVLGTLYNSFKFFETYSALDKWQPPENEKPTPSNLLDQWILARLEETIAAATKSAESYKIAHAILPVFALIDDLSNWYIRRSRRRFWKSQNDEDKQQAYATLHYTLLTVCQLLAPWAPFISDYIWRQLVAGLPAGRQGTDLTESVHLSEWPSVKEPDNTSLKVLEDMKQVKELIVQGLAQRAEAKIKVRQPLSKVLINLDPDRKNEFGELIREELNVKEVEWVNDGDAVKINTEITPELKSEGIARDLIRLVQNARKMAGFNVENRILLKIESSSIEITEAVRQFGEMINSETLTVGPLDGDPECTEEVKLNNQEVKISVKRAGQES